MKNKNKSEAEILRQKAEALLKRKPDKSGSKLSEAEVRKLIHELELYQIELEMQNEELEKAKYREIDHASEKLIDIEESTGADVEFKEYLLSLELAMHAANMAWWKMDLTTGNVTFEKRKAEMLGFPPEKFKHYTDFMALVHPDDYNRTMNALEECLCGSVDKYETEYRILTKSNGYKWVYDIGSIVKKDSKGKPTMVTGLVLDISDKKQAELALHNSEAHLRTLIQTIPDLIWLKDMNGVYISCNTMFERLFGAKVDDIIGKKDYDFVDRELADSFMENDRKAIAADKPTSNEEWVTFADDGHRAFLETIKTPMYDSDGKLLGVLGIGRDISERKLNEQIVQDSEKRFRAIFDQAPIAIALIDMQGYPIISNLPLSRMLGYSSDELSKMKFVEFTYPPDINKDMTQFVDLLNGKISGYSMEKRYVHKNGNIIWANLFVTVLRDRSGLISEIIGMVEDITERKSSEKEVLMLAHSLKSINECVSITDLEDQILFVNESFLKTYGYNLNELIGENISIVRSQANEQKTVDEILPSTILGEWQGELLNRRKDGSEFPIYLSTTIIKDKDGQPLGLIGVAKDITERKQAEDTLFKLSSAVEQTVDSIMITDRDGTIEYVNPAFEVLTGFSSEEAVGKTPRILKSGMEGQEYYEGLWKTILSGKVFRKEMVNKRQNGELYHEEKTISPIFDQNKNITHFVGTGIDITERKRTEEALYKSEKLYRSLFENMLEGFAYCKMIFVDERPSDFIYLAVNKSFETLTGLKDVVGKKVSEVIPGIRESATDLFELYGRVALTGKPETIEIYVEALKMWFSMSVYSPENEHFVSTFEVIDKRKKAEEVLRQSEAKFRNLINSLPDPVLVMDSQGRIVYCNENAVKIFDYNIDEMLNCTMEDLIPKHFRKQHITLRNEYISEPKSRAMGEGKELFAQRKGGSEFPTEIMLEPVEINGNQFTLAIVRDITARKSAEIELIEAKNRAEESDRLKSAFLANMSHEVRTPLNSIIGFSELLAEPDFQEAEKAEFLQHIISNGNNLLSIISDIMDISKLESGELKIHKKKISAQTFISTVRQQFSFQAEEKNIELKLNLPENSEETLIFTDADRLRQVFNNLLSNAIKFTANGSIEIGYYPKGTMVEFYIKDTGIGIPAEYHDIIFKRFRQVETEKTRKFGGNGLGLAISKNLVELMGGNIWLESEPGKGSVFYFTMPMLQ